MKVYLVFLVDYSYQTATQYFKEVCVSEQAAKNYIEWYRDNCDHPPDLEDFVIEEREVIGAAG